MNIDLTLTPEQQRIQQVARDFTARHIMPVAQEMDRMWEWPDFIIPEAVKAGLFPASVPKEYGGPGFDLLTEAIVAEEIGYGCAAFANIISGCMPSVNVVRLAGSEAQKRLVFGRLMEGGMPGLVLTEPGAGSDASAVTTTARLDGDEWVLNGTKCFASYCGYNRIMVIFAVLEPRNEAKKGLSAFVVERERPGLAVGTVEHKLGLRASNSVELLIKNVRIPRDHLLGEEGEAFKYAMRALEGGRAIIAAEVTGIARRALDEAVKFCKGYLDVNSKPLSSHQSVAFKLADMAMQVEAMRQFARAVVKRCDLGLPYSKESSMSKTFATDMAMRVCADAVSLLGSYGYSHDSVVEKLMRDIKIFQIFEGTNQIQRIVISRQLLN